MRLIDADALQREYMQFHDGKRSVLVDVAPTIKPERKKGKWTKENACEFCGFQPWYERDIHTLSFCPNCGADMRGEEDEHTAEEEAT